MTRIARRFLVVLIALLAATPAAFAQAQRTYSQAELDQMLAPVALYPDALLSQILMAATYPVEVAEASRWTRDHPGAQGDDAVRAVQREDWDPSVRSLVAFPQILQRMDENIDWTRSLGDAFLAQESQMMDAVQQLRRRAQAAGTLQSSEQIRVDLQDQTIVLRPVSPHVVYVPYYDPLVVYGPWWWPAYQPIGWAPWPGYAHPYTPGFSAGLWWGRPVGLSVDFFFGDFDWHRRHVRVVNAGHRYYRPRAVVNRSVAVERGRWQHERRAERQPAPLQAQPQATIQAQTRAVRREGRERMRIERREIRQAQPQPRALPQARPQQQALPQPVPRPQVRQEQRPRMPEAQATQQQRAERQERRVIRQEQRSERGRKGGERS